jgi:competence protein ComEC
MRRQHIPVRQVVCGDALSVDPKVKVDVLGPGAVPLSGTRSDLNNNSVVLSVRYGESSFLFTGDLELEGQARLLESGYALNHDVLKVPHHGSRYTSRDFLDSVNPGLAVISVGRNSFGQPHPDIMTLLEDGGRPVFRTDRDGLTVLFSDGRTIKTKIYKR